MLQVAVVVLALAAQADTGKARVAEAARIAEPARVAAAAESPVASDAPGDARSVIRLGAPRFPAAGEGAEEAGAPAPSSSAPSLAAMSPASAAGSATTMSPLPADTPVTGRPRAVAVEYSDWYGRRLVVHRIASYAMVPLFVGQLITGSQLMAKGAAAPSWAIKSHGPMATAMLGVFSVNTVTGVWNLWDGRKDPEGRTSRMLHGVLMLAADAGFMATGALQKPAETSSSMRSLHRTLAISSIGLSLVSYAIMLPPFRR